MHGTLLRSIDCPMTDRVSEGRAQIGADVRRFKVDNVTLPGQNRRCWY